MKRNIYLLSAVILLILGWSKLYAEVNTDSTKKQEVVYTCDSVKTNKEMNQVTLIGNVSVKTKDLISLHCERADWDLNSKKITAYNVTSFDFNGHVILASNTKTLGILVYFIGDNTITIK